MPPWAKNVLGNIDDKKDPPKTNRTSTEEQDPSRRTGNIFAIFLECQANLRESAHVASHKFLWTWHAIAGSKNKTNTTPHITPNEITTRQNKNTPAFGKSEDESSRTSSVNYLPVGSHHNIPGMKSQPNERINIGWKGSALPNHSSIHWNARLQPGDSIFVPRDGDACFISIDWPVSLDLHDSKDLAWFFFFVFLLYAACVPRRSQAEPFSQRSRWKDGLTKLFIIVQNKTHKLSTNANKLINAEVELSHRPRTWRIQSIYGAVPVRCTLVMGFRDTTGGECIGTGTQRNRRSSNIGNQKSATWSLVRQSGEGELPHACWLESATKFFFFERWWWCLGMWCLVSPSRKVDQVVSVQSLHAG